MNGLRRLMQMPQKSGTPVQLKCYRAGGLVRAEIESNRIDAPGIFCVKRSTYEADPKKACAGMGLRDVLNLVDDDMFDRIVLQLP